MVYCSHDSNSRWLFHTEYSFKNKCQSGKASNFQISHSGLRREKGGVMIHHDSYFNAAAGQLELPYLTKKSECLQCGIVTQRMFQVLTHHGIF